MWTRCSFVRDRAETGEDLQAALASSPNWPSRSRASESRRTETAHESETRLTCAGVWRRSGRSIPGELELAASGGSIARRRS